MYYLVARSNISPNRFIHQPWSQDIAGNFCPATEICWKGPCNILHINLAICPTPVLKFTSWRGELLTKHPTFLEALLTRYESCGIGQTKVRAHKIVDIESWAFNNPSFGGQKLWISWNHPQTRNTDRNADGPKITARKGTHQTLAQL